MTQTRFVLALLLLVSGHMLSTTLRTLPAVSADVIAGSLGTTVEHLAGLTGAYYFAFALCQIPVGIALDRFGIRPVTLALLTGTAVAAGLGAIAGGPTGFLVSQIALGTATSGLLMAPMTLAARRLPPHQFGLWSGVILAAGNTGMLVSGSPLAWLVQAHGWRVSFAIGGAVALAIALLALALLPRETRSGGSDASVARQMREALRLGLSPALRGIMSLAVVSVASTLVIRGLWGGPWLLQEKGLSRVETGHVLELFALALIIGPVLVGMLDRRLGRGREIAVVGHLLGAALLLTVAAGARGGPLAELLQVEVVPAAFDAGLFAAAGLALSTQPVLYAMANRLAPPGSAGKALSAVNLAFFVGLAAVQSLTGPVVASFSIAAVFVFVSMLLVAGTAAFWLQTRRAA